MADQLVQTRAKISIHRLLGSLQEFLALETTAGFVLLLCTTIALVWANSPWAASYAAFWHTTAGVAFDHFRLVRDLRFWVNDGLMSVFFLVVGLEIKRELLEGELCSPKRAALPILAALGGVVVPAIIYGRFNAGGLGSAGLGHSDGNRHCLRGRRDGLIRETCTAGREDLPDCAGHCR